MRNDRMSAIEQWDLGRAGGDRQRGRVGPQNPRERRSVGRLGALQGRRGPARPFDRLEAGSRPRASVGAGQQGHLTERATPSTCLAPRGQGLMSSDPGDRDDDAAALRARLDRLSGELKGRAAPPPTAQPSRGATSNGKPDGTGSAMSLGLRAGSEFVSAVIVGLGHRLGSRPRARHQSCVSDCIFPDRRGGGRLERDPADFAKSGVIEPQFALVSRGRAG